MQNVANRNSKVWHGATENGPLNDGQIPNPDVVRVAPGTGYRRVARNRRASRNGPRERPPTRNPSVTSCVMRVR
jgi:hypothetical protein